MSTPDRDWYHRRAPIFLPLAFLAAAGAVLVPGAAVDTDPVPVEVGRGVTLPGLTPFADTLYLVGGAGPGTPGSDPERGLGCTYAGPGADRGRQSSLTTVEPQRVDGRELRVLLELWKYPDGATLTCSGAAAASYRPMYLVGVRTNGDARLFLGGGAVVFALLGLVVRLATRPDPALGPGARP